MPAYRTAFLSHAHLDNEICARYASALRAKGIDVWIDLNNAQVGHDLTDDIDQELKRRTAFVLMVTAHSNASHWVKQERGAYNALMNTPHTRVVNGVERMILPVRLEDEVPAIFGGVLWVDALHLAFEQAVEAIARALVIGAPTAPVITVAPAPQLPGTPIATHARLASLGFAGRSVKGVDVIIPPMCDVPAGEFLMGSDKSKDPQAWNDEMPQYRMLLDHAYQIGAYPVTVAEYACAVRANVVRKPPELDDIDWTKQVQRIDYPVVCVSWQDALAYVRWLASVTSQPWRLPTEAEWEKAARGTDGYVYPWGNQWDWTRANMSDGGPGTATPVGSYADKSDASPFGMHDLAGNVWEWTSSLFRLYPYSENDGRENLDSAGDRVLRGGSWFNQYWGVRTAFRGKGISDGLIYQVGFRLVRDAGG